MDGNSTEYSPESNDERMKASPSELYNEMMMSLVSQTDTRLLGAKKARVSEAEQRQAAQYLLECDPLPNIPPPKPIISTTAATALRNEIYQQRQDFLTRTNMSHTALEYCGRCLNYMGDQCAKQSQPDVGALAWRKMREMGFLPSEGTISTFLYILFDEAQDSNTSEERLKASMEAVTMHGTLFRTTEKTLALRVKMLVSQGSVEDAEQLISGMDNNVVSRLRTFLPILQHFCGNLDTQNLSRIYRTMKSCAGVHMDAETYSVVLIALANKIAKETSHNVEIGLFHSIANDMAEDIMEVSEDVANRLVEGIQESAGFLATRVTIDDGALCPNSGARLRLFSLSPEKRRYVHNTLLDMAHGPRMQKAPNNAKRRKSPPPAGLRQFSTWLKYRLGTPFTVFIDGPNVAYFGHKELDWTYIQRMVQQVEALGETPLVIMPSKYIAPSFQLSTDGSTQELSDEARSIIQKLNSTRQLYVVPSGSFDDYYWMISSVAEQNATKLSSVLPSNDTQRFPGLRPLVVTNDQMRDHQLQLLEPRFFRRWSSCHFVNYWMSNETIQLYPADFYSREIQCNKAAEYANAPVWHIPVTEWGSRERLCVGINIAPKS